MRKKIIIAILILGVALASLGFWYWSKNFYSKEVLKLEIMAPKEASIFEEVEYIVKFKNNGNISLENPLLVFEFPEYTLAPFSSDDNGDIIRRQEIGPEEIGDIYPGEEKIFKFKGRLFGKEDHIKTAKVWLEYNPKNISARYESSTTVSTIIETIPLTFDFDISSRVEASRDFKFSLNYFSSLNYPLTNLGVKIEYPQGFEFVSSNPKSLGKNEWEIPLLNRADGGRIEINGSLSGEVKEQKIFRAVLGAWQDNEFIELKEITKGVELSKPDLQVIQRINGKDDYVARPGDTLHYEIFFRNVSGEPFTDLFLVTYLDGKAFNFNNVNVSDGEFREGDNSIVWDWHDVSKLKFLGEGEEGKLEFWVSLKNWTPSSPQDTNFFLKNRILVSEVKEEFETKIASNLEVIQKAYYKEDTFDNLGPIPPEVSKKTQYTIVWQAKNYHNDVRNVTVKAVLPPNVELTGNISPESESSKFAFDRISREIIWRISDGDLMPAGTGIFTSAPKISFQVSLTPSLDQKGSFADIIGDARISGEDLWADAITGSMDESISTSLPDDLTNNGRVKN